jgi:coproporphyrinogen III oxidase-like Fe-S oxidoreductase
MFNIFTSLQVEDHFKPGINGLMKLINIFVGNTYFVYIHMYVFCVDATFFCDFLTTFSKANHLDNVKYLKIFKEDSNVLFASIWKCFRV